MTQRRNLLKGVAGAVLAGMMADRVGGQTRPLPDVGRKFSSDGRVLPFLGNTIICHLPQQGEGSEAFDALLDIYRELPGDAWTRKLTATPPSSYHMTVFGGADDRDRRYPVWPAGLPLDVPIEDCNRILGERLKSFRLGEDAPPYRMRVNLAEPPANESPLNIRLLSADEDTEQRLRRLRDRLAVTLGIHDSGHDSYRFHVTLGYLVADLSTEEHAAYRRSLTRWKQLLAQRVPVITLGAPEYCVLRDMFAFKRQFFLA
ncbi:DUF1868 domain-containing protein [Sphingomonas sp. H39-1-10]|uniref:DUF1868 domain-containing protein n=1 Tax=Sphingomonas pollutisoli TaxID=3030829 RepID=UPI0023B99170|nr:DUF1868 domain-containing protein [Sphingomonas pollutisoli]MDF0490168.1 DUF1868 domain-containing protein [Sphingomonas pollutisoli]